MLLFLIKISAGFFYGHYFSTQPQILKADTWEYFIESLQETNLFLRNPQEFFFNTFQDYQNTSGALFETKNSFWNNLKFISFTKFLALINLFSNSNYYINVIIFNILFMFSNVALYKLISEIVILNKKLLLASIFLIPSFLLWCSAVHKDGLIFSATVFIIYLFYKILYFGLSIKRIVFFAFCLIMIFMLRNFFLLAIIPSLLGMILVIKYRLKAKIVFFTIIASSLIVFSFSDSIFFLKKITYSIVSKHDEFSKFEGVTKFETPKLDFNPQSIVSYFPFAISSVFLRPYPNSFENIPRLMATIENYGILLLFLIACFMCIYKKISKETSLILHVFLSICFFWFLFIGYVVCFEGAIVRYKSTVMPFMICSAVIIIFGKHNTSNRFSLNNSI